MFSKFSKTIQELLNVHSLWEIIKKHWPSIKSFIISLIYGGGGYMISNWLGGGLLFIGTVGIIAFIKSCIKTQIDPIKKEIELCKEILSVQNEIQNKVVILPDITVTTSSIPNSNDYNCWVIFYIYNCSNQSINYLIDTKQSQVKINTITAQEVQKHSSTILPPYHLSQVISYPIKLQISGDQTILHIIASLFLTYDTLKNNNYFVSHEINQKFHVTINDQGAVNIIPIA